MAAQRTADLLAGTQIPQPDGAIGVAAGQGVAMWAECHRDHAAALTDGQEAGPLAGGHVPEPDPIDAAAGHSSAVVAERHREHRAEVVIESDGRAGFGYVPQPDPASPGAGQSRAVWAEG